MEFGIVISYRLLVKARGGMHTALCLSANHGFFDWIPYPAALVRNDGRPWIPAALYFVIDSGPE